MYMYIAIHIPSSHSTMSRHRIATLEHRVDNVAECCWHFSNALLFYREAWILKQTLTHLRTRRSPTAGDAKKIPSASHPFVAAATPRRARREAVAAALHSEFFPFSSIHSLAFESRGALLSLNVCQVHPPSFRSLVATWPAICSPWSVPAFRASNRAGREKKKWTERKQRQLGGPLESKTLGLAFGGSWPCPLASWIDTPVERGWPHQTTRSVSLC